MWEIKIEIAPDQTERVDEILAENEIVGWHLFSDVAGGSVWLSGFFAESVEARERWEELRGLLPEEAVVGEAELSGISPDWKESYRAHFHRWTFGKLHWVPVWERASFVVPEGEEVVWLDPGMAFGTGNHETTRLCVERLVEVAGDWRKKGRELESVEVIDAGCGSGILAISAARLGFGRISGFDNDPVAVEVSRENAQLNGLSERITFYNADIVDGLRGRRVDLLVANILADVLSEFAKELLSALRPGGRLILSGILAVEVGAVEAHFRKLLPEGEFRKFDLNEWTCLEIIAPEK